MIWAQIVCKNLKWKETKDDGMDRIIRWCNAQLWPCYQYRMDPFACTYQKGKFHDLCSGLASWVATCHIGYHTGMIWILVAPLCIQFPAIEGDPHAWVPEINVGDPGEALDSWFQASAAPVIMAVWRVRQMMENISVCVTLSLFPFSLYLTLSLSLPFPNSLTLSNE